MQITSYKGKTWVKNTNHSRLFTLPLLLIASVLFGLGSTHQLRSAQLPSAPRQEIPADTVVLIPLFIIGDSTVPVALPERLLATGQTIGYQGNVGVPASGNRDDGDLLRGRTHDYEYADVDIPTTQVENLIIDRNTGLMWIRDVSVVSGDDAAGVAGTIPLNETYDWESAIERANTLVYADFEDWRLPNLKEMQTLVDYGTSEPSINTTAFPLAYEEYSSNYFWTSTTFSPEPDNAFYTNFLNGHTFRFAKTTPFALRPVRSIDLANPNLANPIALLQTGQTTSYADDDDGELQLGLAQQFEYVDDGLIDTEAENIANDLNTGLMWIRDPLLLADFAQPLDWQGSIDRVNQLEYGGYDDWHMPNIVELESIFQAGDAVDVLDPTVFPNKPVDPDDMEAVIWWSSTTSAYDKDANTLGKDAAWYTTSAIGTTNFGNTPNTNFNPVKLRPGYVRPVRDINSPEPDNRLYLGAIESAADFALVARNSSRPDLLAEGKFIFAADPNSAPFNTAYQNVETHPLHYEFLQDAFPADFAGLTATQYTALVTRRATREYWAGGLRSFVDAAGQLAYGFDVYVDPLDENELLTQQETAALYARLAQSFGLRPLVYSPTRQAAIDQAQSWQEPGFAIGFPAAAAAPEYEAYTLGQTYGRVRIMTLVEMEDAAAAGELSRQEIVVIDGTPTDLESIVAGIVTGERQGDLTHLNVRTARRGTPNTYIKDAPEQLAAYAGQLVRLSVARAEYLVETDVPLADAERWWNASRPPTVTVRAPEYTYRSIDNFPAISSNDLNGSATTRFGGKAANLARLYAFLPDQYEVRGFAIPFAYYAEFMQANTLSSEFGEAAGETYADYITSLHQDPTFRGDSVARAQLLDAFRDEMRANGVVSPTLVAELVSRVDQTFGEGTKVRFRSSSNAEDGLAFNGAGLYDSTSVCVLDTTDDDEVGPSRCDPSKSKERTIERALKKVWASQWNFRAWEERDYYGIDHLDSAMAILVTTAFPDERANGVAFTGDPSRVGGVAVNDGLAEYLINVQAGDLSVVLPDPGVVPERDQLTVQDGVVTQVTRVRGSSEVATGEYVMSDAELTTLGAAMALADDQFPLDLGTHDRADVLLDFEFKIRREDNQLLIKQVRPFLTREPNSGAQSALLRVHTPQSIDLCGGWRESVGLLSELQEKARLTLPAGDLEIPLTQSFVDGPILSPEDVRLNAAKLIHIPFGMLSFGYPLVDVLPGEETYGFDIETVGNDGELRVTLARRYMDDTREIRLSLTFSNLRTGEFALRRLDALNLAGLMQVTATVHDTVSENLLTRLQFVPCALEQLPLIEFDVALENDQRLVLRQRRERDDGITGLAALASAEVTLADAAGTLITQIVDDYARLVYAAERHHWNEEFLVLLEPPIGDAHAIKLRRNYTGGESSYKAELMNASLDPLRVVAIESVVRE